VWGGFNLCSTNFIYDAVTPQKRVRCLGYFTLFNGISIFLGATLGGYLANHLPALFGFQLMSLFLFSCALRWIGYFTFSGLFKEVRENVSHATRGQVFLSILGLRPLKGLSRGWGFFPKMDAGEKEIETKPE
jgi:MFS family permease